MIEPIYSPQHKDQEALTNDFVIRHHEYKRIMESINADKPGEAPQHILLQGVRGMGKTTLMYRVFYEVMENYREQGLIPVIFSEEQYGVRTLYKLWEAIGQYLEDNEPEYAGILQRMENLEGTDDAYEEQAFALLKSELEQRNHRLILFIDNFGVMVDKFKKRGQQRLREILIDFPRIKIIGGSTVVLESFFRYDKPFFEFFKILHLNKLDTEEVKTMLRMLGKRHGTDDVEEIIQNQPGRVASLRILTNGVPRTIVLLFNIFLDNINGESIDDLKQLLDQVTPLYQQRMDNLPPQQQEIVEKLALNWDGMSVAELRQKTRMSGKAISAQLNNLEKSQIVTSKQSSGKNKFYQLEERFFNIWYLMHHGPRSYKRKVIWLTRFLELWCGQQQLRKHIKHFRNRLKQESLHPEYALSMVNAYAQARGITEEDRDALIESAQESLKSRNKQWEQYLPETIEGLYAKLKKLINDKAYDAAKASIRQAAISEGIAEFLLGLVNHIGKSPEEAEEHYLKAIEHQQLDAMYNLAILNENQERYAEAEKYYLMAVEKNLVEAIFNLGNFYENQERYEEAEKYYLMATNQGYSKSLMNLTALRIQSNEVSKIPETRSLIEGFWIQNNDPIVKLAKVYFLLWVEEPDQAVPLLKETLPDVLDDEKLTNILTGILAFAIAKGLRQAILKLFRDETYQLKDRFKVVYYALMQLMEDEYPDELRKMGKELEEPVQEMVNYIRELAAKYQ